MKYTLADAVLIAQILESRLAPLGWHTALTGSCLIRGDSDKDIDIVVYQDRVVPDFSHEKLRADLVTAGFLVMNITDTEYTDRVVIQGTLNDRAVDVFQFHG